MKSYLWKEPFWRKLPDELIDIFLWTIFSLAILLDQPKVFIASLSKSGRGWAAWIHPTRGTSLRCCLFCGISPCRKSKILINSFQRYWSSKKPAICLDESILDYKLWSTIFLDMEFAKKNRIPRSFIVYYFQQMIWQNFDENSRKLYFGPIFGPCYPWFGRTKIFLDNALMLLFDISRFLWLCITSEKTN